MAHVPFSQVQIVEGSVKGIKMRFIDTPGLLLSPGKVAHNADVLAQVPSQSPSCCHTLH